VFTSELQLKNSVRFYRQLNDLTFAELGALMGRSDRGISAIERGKSMPSLEFAFRLAKLFNLSVHELFFLEGEEPEKRVVYMNK
jgi:putative transcriptional regulator